MPRQHPGILRLLPAFIILATLSSLYVKADIHKQMHIDELNSIFHVTAADEVPDYQLIRVRALGRRSTGRDSNYSEDSSKTHELHLSAFGQNFQLRLHKNEHLSRSADRLRMFFAEGRQQDGSLNITELQSTDANKDVGEIYQDTANGAAILLHRDKNGALLVDGTIGSTIVIKPLPERMRQVNVNPPDDQFFLDNELPPVNISKERLFASHVDHVVYQQQPHHNDKYSDYMLMEPDKPIKKRRSTYSKRDAPDSIWPEVLVIVDFDTYNMHGGNNVDIKRYFISFWNGVDLRYKLLTGPKVRVSLAGIIISKGRDATPYLENNRVGGNAVDSAGALTELGKYLFRERRLPTYDIAVVITKLDLCRREFTPGGCNKGTAGFAYVGGACVVNKRLEKVNSVAIIEDTGGFSGIIVAAHEVGHLLGAVHDGSPPPSYLGGPGAEHCRWEDGYIMSDLRHTDRGFKWSVCSIQQFKHFLNGDTAKCLYNIPHEDEELPRLLPGKLLSLDSQCRKDRGTSACFKDDRVCAQLFCFDSRSGYCVSYRPAAEGSPCGDSQFCLNGRCVSELENVIPDYSSITETVVSKTGVAVPTADLDPVNVVPYGPAAASTKSSELQTSTQQQSGGSDISGSNLDPAISDGVFDYFRA